MKSTTLFGSALIALFGTVALASTDAEAQQFNRGVRGRPIVVTQPARPVIVTQPGRPVFVARPVAQPVYAQPVYAPRYGRGRDLRAQAARAEAMRIQAAREAEIRAHRDAMERARIQARGPWGRYQR